MKKIFVVSIILLTVLSGVFANPTKEESATTDGVTTIRIVAKDFPGFRSFQYCTSKTD